jgi:hypothetical protein
VKSRSIPVVKSLATLLVLVSTVARAEYPTNAPPLAVQRPLTRTWPLTVDVHLMVGMEPHAPQGIPVAFGIGAELMWQGKLGGFAAVLASQASPILPVTINGVMQASLADRISLPFGLVVRPLRLFLEPRDSWAGQLLDGIGVQLGATVEHLGTSDADTWTGGLHAALSVDVPLWGGPTHGGLALRLLLRGLFTPSVALEANKSVREPVASGQFYFGLCYYP